MERFIYQTDNDDEIKILADRKGKIVIDYYSDNNKEQVIISKDEQKTFLRWLKNLIKYLET